MSFLDAYRTEMSKPDDRPKCWTEKRMDNALASVNEAREYWKLIKKIDMNFPQAQTEIDPEAFLD